MTVPVRAALAALALAATVASTRSLPAQVPDARLRGEVGGATKGAAKAPGSIAVSRGRTVIFRDPNTFEQLGKVKLSETVQDLRQIGDFTYVLTKCAMYIVDARNPALPMIISRVPFPECTSVRFLAEACPDGTDTCPNELFIERGTSVTRYALDTTATPPTLTEVDQHSAADVKAHEVLPGHKGVVAQGAGGLALVDWSASPPLVLDRFVLPEISANIIATVGDHVFSPVNENLNVFDASGTDLVLEGSFPVNHVSVMAGDPGRNLLFVASNEGLLRALRLPLAAMPVAAFTYSFPPPIQDLRVDGDQLFIFTSYAFFAKDPANPSSKRFAPSAPVTNVLWLPASNPPIQVFVTGTGLQGYTLDFDASAFVADTLAPRAHHVAPHGDQKSFFASSGTGVSKITFNAGTFTTQGTYALADARGLEAVGDRVFVTTGGTLEVVDFSDQEHPFLVARIELSGEPKTVTVNDSAVYVASGSGGMHVVDISNLTEPSLVVTLQPPILDRALSDVQDLAVSGDKLAVAAGDNGFHLYNVADPQNPTYITGVAQPTTHVTLNSNLLYAGKGDVRIYDVTDPAIPVLEAVARTGSDQGGAVGIITAVTFSVSAGDAGVLYFDLPPLITQVLDGILARSENPSSSDRNGDGVTDSADIIQAVVG